MGANLADYNETIYMGTLNKFLRYITKFNTNHRFLWSNVMRQPPKWFPIYILWVLRPLEKKYYCLGLRGYVQCNIYFIFLLYLCQLRVPWNSDSSCDLCLNNCYKCDPINTSSGYIARCAFNWLFVARHIDCLLIIVTVCFVISLL